MIVLRAEGHEKSRNKGWTEEMGVWYPTRGQIGNRSDPQHGKHRNDARPFLINRQPLLSLSFSLSLLLLRLSFEIYWSTLEPFRIEFAPLELYASWKLEETVQRNLKLYAQMQGTISFCYWKIIVAPRVGIYSWCLFFVLYYFLCVWYACLDTEKELNVNEL